jgi:tellurite resistance protein TehA-like permease
MLRGAVSKFGASVLEGFYSVLLGDGHLVDSELAVLAMWRYVYQRFPLKYDPLYWGAVFPLGMYTACTFQMAQVIELDFLIVLPRIFIYVALVARLATFLGLCRTLCTGLVWLFQLAFSPRW